MKWLLIIFVNGSLAGSIELESEQACIHARTLIETEIAIPTPGSEVRMSCLPAGPRSSERQ